MSANITAAEQAERDARHAAHWAKRHAERDARIARQTPAERAVDERVRAWLRYGGRPA